MKENTLITLTRQYGSGGYEIAEILAKKLGIKCYDRNIVCQAAENLNETDDIQSVLKNAYETPNDFVARFFSLSRGASLQSQMYFEQARIIQELAKKGSAVFVGRCADYILREMPNRYSFFIYAEENYRRKRVKEVYKDCALEDVRDVDKKRKSYYAYYTGQTWGDPQNYDLMINTTKISVEEAADLILSYIELLQR